MILRGKLSDDEKEIIRRSKEREHKGAVHDSFELGRLILHFRNSPERLTQIISDNPGLTSTQGRDETSYRVSYEVGEALDKLTQETKQSKISLIRAILLLRSRELEMESTPPIKPSENLIKHLPGENITKVLRWWASESKAPEWENSPQATAMYRRLGWEGKDCKFDILRSFFRPLMVSLAVFATEYNPERPLFKLDKKEILLDTPKGYICNIKKKRFAEEYLGILQDNYRRAEKDALWKQVCDLAPLQELAGLTYTLSSIYPVPNYWFNLWKGIVYDSLPLFLDLINKAEDGMSLDQYNQKNPGGLPDLTPSLLQEIKNFFVRNREKFLLNDYFYGFSDGNLIPFRSFSGESIEHLPLPDNKERLIEMLNSEITRLNSRALRIKEALE